MKKGQNGWSLVVNNSPRQRAINQEMHRPYPIDISAKLHFHLDGIMFVFYMGLPHDNLCIRNFTLLTLCVIDHKCMHIGVKVSVVNLQ